MQRQMILNRVCLALIALVLITATWPQSAYAQSGFTCTYTVQSGDNLSSIAQRYGVKYPEIKAASGISSDTITVGQTLMVPCQAGVPSPTPTQVSVAPVANPQNTPVSVPPQDCPGCAMAQLPFNWQVLQDTGDSLLVSVALVEPTPLGEGVLVVREVYNGGRIVARVYSIAKRVLLVSGITTGVTLATLLPTTGVQPTAAATPLTPQQALELESKKELTKEEQEAIQSRARENKKQGCLALTDAEIQNALWNLPLVTKGFDPNAVKQTAAKMRYTLTYSSWTTPYPSGTKANVVFVNPSVWQVEMVFTCQNTVWTFNYHGFNRFANQSAPAAAPAQPTSVPPTVTPVPAPPTATSVPPTPIIATATPSGCGALIIDGVQIVASASHGQPADQIVDGVVKTRRWCNNGNWQ